MENTILTDFYLNDRKSLYSFRKVKGINLCGKNFFFEENNTKMLVDKETGVILATGSTLSILKANFEAKKQIINNFRNSKAFDECKRNLIKNTAILEKKQANGEKEI